MVEKTVDDLKRLREELVRIRRQQAYGALHAPSEFPHDLRRLVEVHQAIAALDAVIEKEIPSPDPEAISR